MTVYLQIILMQWWRLLMGSHKRRRGEIFSPYTFSEGQAKILEGRTVMVPNFSLKAKWKIRASNSSNR